jgi:hypothetical protein
MIAGTNFMAAPLAAQCDENGAFSLTADERGAGNMRQTPY